jgi:hypothetical protein
MRPNPSPKVCSFVPCTRPVASKGLCTGHYQQYKRGKDLVELVKYSPRIDVTVRDECGNKLCRKCGTWLPESSFGLFSSAKDGLYPHCKLCKALLRKSRHNISSNDFKEMFEEQGSCCMICGNTSAPGNGWHLDHDHKCCPGSYSCGGCLRGILCSSCNVGLGFFRDNINSLQKAIEYLSMVG